MTPASTPRTRFRERLGQRPLLADGGMGTLMYSRGVPQSACLDELAATRPELVGAAHREYMDAGAELIETLSLGANRRRLAAVGLETEVQRLNRRAAQVAREAREVSGRDALVGGSIGPLAPPNRGSCRAFRTRGAQHVPGTARRPARGRHRRRRPRDVPDLEQLLLALDAARRRGPAGDRFDDVRRRPHARRRDDRRRAAGLLASAGADVVGVNCGVGPSASIEVLEADGPRPADDTARSIMPNAGLPQRRRGALRLPRRCRSTSPRSRRARSRPGRASSAAAAGRRPLHIAAMRPALERSRRRPGHAATPTEVTLVPDRTPRSRDRAELDAEVPAADPACRAACAQRFVVSVEIDPPRRVASSATIEAARLLQDAGVDAINVADSPMARVRMSAFAVAFGIQHDLGLECIVHCTTRDRNLMALQSELLGAHALGVRNIIALDRRSAARRRLPDRHGRVRRRLDRAHRHPDAAQPRRGPVRVADRRSRRLHDRLRGRSDRGRRRDRVGPPRAASSTPGRTWS